VPGEGYEPPSPITGAFIKLPRRVPHLFNQAMGNPWNGNS